MSFNDIYSERVYIDRNLFYIDKIMVEANGCVKIVKRKQFVGLQYGTEEVLPTVFDSISFISDGIVEAQIKGLTGLFSVDSNTWLFEPNQYQLKIPKNFENVIEIKSDKGFGLFSIRGNRMVVPPEYNETTYSDICEFLWVRIGDYFHFIKNGSSTLYSATDAMMAYDTDKGMWVKHSDGRVALLNNAGNDDIKAYRRKLIENHGRVKLQNIKLNIVDICDIYGQVIN